MQSRPNRLPTVSEGTNRALLGDFIDNPNLIEDTIRRLLVEQPALSRRIGNYISERAGNEEEALCMLETFALTYKLLESQATTNGMIGIIESIASDA